MYIATQGFSHFSATDIRDRMKGETIVKFVVVQQILSDAVHDQVQELMLLVEEECNSEVTYLLFRVLGRGDEVDSFQVSKVDIVSLYIDVEKLAHIFFLLVAIQLFALEFLSDIGQFFVDPLLFQFAGSSVA